MKELLAAIDKWQREANARSENAPAGRKLMCDGETLAYERVRAFIEDQL